MTDVLKELQQWAVELPFWERFALDKILFGRITDSDYDELLRFLLEDADLVQSTSERPVLRLLQTADVEPEAITQPVRLRSVSNLRNVNALVSGQKLTFSSALTAVYGGNGSGKSGYSCILGCAGFTRGDDFILPDITQPVVEGTVPAAEIEIEIGDETNVIDFQVGSYYLEIGCFYMFDSTAARTHLNEKQTITFSPYGLSALTGLADVTDKVRERLQALIAQKTNPRDFGPFFRAIQRLRTWCKKINFDPHDCYVIAVIVFFLQPFPDLRVPKFLGQSTQLRQAVDLYHDLVLYYGQFSQPRIACWLSLAYHVLDNHAKNNHLQKPQPFLLETECLQNVEGHLAAVH